jgi:hypothetical protein
MSTPISLLVLIAVTTLFWLELRTLIRERKSGVPYLFWWPHPAFRSRPANRRSGFLLFSSAGHVFGVFVLGLMVVTAIAFLLESLGVIYQ